MAFSHQTFSLNGIPIVRMESALLTADVAPQMGGKIISLVHKPSRHEFLWRNRSLQLERLSSGSEYDPNFYGGVDELLPNDIIETIDGVNCPDHGELWTTPLEWNVTGQSLNLSGSLPLFGLVYERQMTLRPDAPVVDLRYRISNPTNRARHFLWKLHAALASEPGDLIECPARKARVVDPAWSRFKTLVPFDWPHLEGQAVNQLPQQNGTMDFFYLFDLKAGKIALRNKRRGIEFRYEFDPSVFPYAWVFASYGGFNGHYTVILEPCTAMPISVEEAAAKKQCSLLLPQQAIETSVSIYAGPAE